MKKIMILLLSLAVLFSFAACDNSSNTPDTGDETNETPVNIDYAKYAAEGTAALFYGQTPSIKIGELIGEANEYERSFDGKNVVIEKTQSTGDWVGTIKITLSGDYTAPTKSGDDGTLAVNDYTIEAKDLKVYIKDVQNPASESTYSTYSFNITGAIKGIADITIAKGTTVPDIGSATAVYAPLPGQSASITMVVPVSVDADGNTKYETRTYSDAEYKANLAALATSKPAEYMEEITEAYLADVNAKDVDLVKLVASFVDGSVTEEQKKTANATVTYDVTTAATADNKWEEKGTVTITFTGTNYDMDGSKLTGTFTLSFPEASRKGNNAAPTDTVDVSLGEKFEISGTDIKLAGGDYPVTLSVEKAIQGGTVTGGTVTMANGKVSKFTAPSRFGSYTSGLLDVNGVEILVTSLDIVK